ncbi:hypothetical protein A1O3_02864 [Capronia epimyces CBS 606.96]|uniref:Ketoreductase domain-containing protein n=1 Tax=Capronia epimyces CBS 606.96 TaxID=1182542 RepID=W9YAC2_9EURO|nr:uncharacterized protein A1O3_02864 [Capronia epimyces CBS 606.96]EXJ89797.1 hypothetical protein A1O3_02864 [Capronia epimyces CBS 606.96]
MASTVPAPFPSPTATWHNTTYPSLSPTRPELSAKGKTVIITGGGTGIGAETARYFAQAGASRIGLLGRREQPLLDTKASIEQKFTGVDVFVAPTDITKQDQVDAAFAKFVDDGKIDVVVSNAAVVGTQDPVREVDADKFLDGVQKNLSGALLVAQAFLRYAAPGAVAINVSSSVAHVDFTPSFASYGVAKMAVIRLWDSVAFANPDLSVFHIQPGVVDTDMNKEAGGVAAVGFSDHVSLPASFNVWLASPEARFLKGRFLWTNWDVDELKAQAKEIEAGTRFKIGLVGWPFEAAWRSPWKEQ